MLAVQVNNTHNLRTLGEVNLSKRKSEIKWSSKIEDFILDRMCEGMQPAHIFKKYSSELPSLRTFNRKQLDDAIFRDKVDAAYTVIYQMKMAEMDTLSSGVASSHFPGVDFKEAEAALKRRIDTLKFDLGKMAGTMSKRFNTKQVVEHTGSVDSNITYVIANYTKNTEKVINQQPTLMEDHNK